MCDVQDYERLLDMQQEDGAWPLGWFYRNGGSGLLTGNQGLTTAMAVAAIRRYREVQRLAHVQSDSREGFIANTDA